MENSDSPENPKNGQVLQNFITPNDEPDHIGEKQLNSIVMLEPAIVLRALDSDVRRQLLLELLNPIDCEGCIENMKVRQLVLDNSTVYKHLDVLVKAGLVQKYYDVATKKITYRTNVHDVAIQLRNNDILCAAK
jgi:predicted transcriptional regulator